MSGRVHAVIEKPLGFLVFDHVERRNAITLEMWRDIAPATEELARDNRVRVVILRGAGDAAFVSGADISEFEELRSGEKASQYNEANARAFAALARIDKPVLAMIHGFCIGGGLAIALCADIRYAAEDAVFALPPARLGLGYAASGLETLVHTVGLAAAKEILFTARRFNADEALARHLVSAVKPSTELESFVRRTALTIAENAPLTIRSAKIVLRELVRPVADRDQAAMGQSIADCYGSDDYAEGVRAFLEKRKPVFQGH